MKKLLLVLLFLMVIGCGGNRSDDREAGSKTEDYDEENGGFWTKHPARKFYRSSSWTQPKAGLRPIPFHRPPARLNRIIFIEGRSLSSQAQGK